MVKIKLRFLNKVCSTCWSRRWHAIMRLMWYSLANSPKIVRQEIASHKGFHFGGKFPSGCQEELVSSTPKTRVSMWLNDADLRDQDSKDSQVILTDSRSILFNNFNFKKQVSSSRKSQHPLDREPSPPMYTGMKMWVLTEFFRLSVRLRLLFVRTFRTKELWFHSVVKWTFNCWGAWLPGQ